MKSGPNVASIAAATSTFWVDAPISGVSGLWARQLRAAAVDEEAGAVAAEVGVEGALQALRADRVDEWLRDPARRPQRRASAGRGAVVPLRGVVVGERERDRDHGAEARIVAMMRCQTLMAVASPLEEPRAAPEVLERGDGAIGRPVAELARRADRAGPGLSGSVTASSVADEDRLARRGGHLGGDLRVARVLALVELDDALEAVAGREPAGAHELRLVRLHPEPEEDHRVDALVRGEELEDLRDGVARLGGRRDRSGCLGSSGAGAARRSRRGGRRAARAATAPSARARRR